MKQSKVIIELKTNNGAIIRLKDMPTALNIVNSESLLNLSKVKRVPKSNPIGKALPNILGISHNNINMPVLTDVSPVNMCLITFNKISGAIQTIINKRIATKVAPKTCPNMYLSYTVIRFSIL